MVPCATCVLVVATSRPKPPNLEGESFGSYILGRVLGQGGMGVVYEARDTRLGRTVALKLLADDFDAADVLRREAEIVASIEHEHIVPIYEADEHEGIAYFTMKLIDGGPLVTPAPTARRAAEIALAIAKAIDFAHHRGILHLDLKPANVLVDRSGKPFVTDFGLAISEGLSAGAPLAPGGTPLYMAPEVWRGDRNAASVAADVWGVGALLYEMLAGRPPFKASTKDELKRRVTTERPLNLTGISDDLAAICYRCLEKNPAHRYRTAADLAADITRYLEGDIVDAHPNARWHHRIERVFAALAFVLVIFVAIFILFRGQPLSGSVADEVANSVAMQMTDTLRNYAASVEAASRAPDVIDALSDPKAVHPSDVCARLQEHSWADSAWLLLDTQGRLVGRAPQKDPEADQVFTFRDYYRGAEENERNAKRSAYVSRAYRSALDDDYKVAFSITVHDKMHTRVGMLVATVPTGSRALLESIKIPPQKAKNTSFAVIVPRDPYNADGTEVPAVESVFLVQPALARGEELSVHVDGTWDQGDLMTAKPIFGTYFSVIVRVTNNFSNTPTIPKL